MGGRSGKTRGSCCGTASCVPMGWPPNVCRSGGSRPRDVEGVSLSRMARTTPIRSLVLLCMVTACAAGCVAPVQPERTAVVSVAPIRLGIGWLCPTGFGYRAFDMGAKVFMPPVFPGLKPIGAQPVACFSSSEDALQAGYVLAPTPPGYDLVSGVYFSHVSDTFMGKCSETSRLLSTIAFCPRLVPLGWEQNATVDFRSDRLVLSASFPAAPEYVGVGPGEGHLNIWEAGPHGFSGGFGCPEGRFVGKIMVRSIQGRWKVCPEGSELDSGHLILEWKMQHVTVAVSLHRPSVASRSMALFIASRMI